MVLLGLSGLALFAVSVTALVVPKNWQDTLFLDSWKSFSDSQKSNIQDNLDCCGFNEDTRLSLNCDVGHPACNDSTILLKVG